MDVKKQPWSEEVQPRLMRYSDISRATDAAYEAIRNDPMFRYILSTPKRKGTPFGTKSYFKFLMLSSFLRYIHLKMAMVVEDGQAHVVFIDPTRPPDSKDKIISTILAQILNILKLGNSDEETKREKEIAEKTDRAIEKALGERRHEMFVVAGLTTHPARQGRGYGSALVKAVTDQADAMGRATWLHSSNTKDNTGFYNSLGFITVAEILIGDDNPTWKEEPFVTAIMLREPLAAPHKTV